MNKILIVCAMLMAGASCERNDIGSQGVNNEAGEKIHERYGKLFYETEVKRFVKQNLGKSRAEVQEKLWKPLVTYQNNGITRDEYIFDVLISELSLSSDGGRFAGFKLVYSDKGALKKASYLYTL